MKFKQFGFSELVSKTPNVRGIPTNEYRSKGRYPVIDQGNEFIAGYSDNENALYKDTLPVVVFGDHTLSVKYLDFPFCVGADGTQILKPNTDVIIGKFLYYAIINLNIQSLGYSRHFKVLKKSFFHVPDIEEQHRIVKILDLAQSLIEKRKQAIALLDDYIKAVFLDMFGDPVSNPKGWEVKKLKEVCTKIADGTHYSPPLVENGTPYITARHLKPKGLDFFRNPTYISREEHDKIYSRCTPEKGDVLYIKDGATTGVAAINYYDFEFSMLSSLALLKPNNEFIRNHYLCYWLNNPRVKSNLLQQMAGVAIQRFTLTKINNFLVPTPPLELQDNFSKIFEKTNPIQLQMQTQLKELEDNFQAQLQSAFRGDYIFRDVDLIFGIVSSEERESK